MTLIDQPLQQIGVCYQQGPVCFVAFIILIDQPLQHTLYSTCPTSALAHRFARGVTGVPLIHLLSTLLKYANSLKLLVEPCEASCSRCTTLSLSQHATDRK